MRKIFYLFLFFPFTLPAQQTTSITTFDCNNLSYYLHLTTTQLSNDTLFVPTSCGALQSYAEAFDMNMNLLWSVKVLPDSFSPTMGGSCMLSDGSLLIMYTSNLTGWGTPLATKISRSGATIWTKMYTSWGANNLMAVTALPDGGFACAGGGCLGGNLAMRCDANGDVVWIETFSGIGPFGNSTSINLVDNGTDLLIGGYFDTGGNIFDLRLLNIDLNGNFSWCRNYHLPGSSVMWAVKSIPGVGGYVITGSNDPGTGSNPLLMRIDNSGNLLWARTDSTGSDGDFNSVCILPDNTLLVGGAKSMVWHNMGFYKSNITHYDLSGNFLESYSLPIDSINYRYMNDYISDIIYSQSQNLVYVGGAGSNIGMIYTIFPGNIHPCTYVSIPTTVMTPQVTVTQPAGIQSPTSITAVNENYAAVSTPLAMYTDCMNFTTGNAPQPDENSVSVIAGPNSILVKPEKISTLSIYDVNGRLVTMRKISGAETIDCSAWTNGLYILRFVTDDGQAVSKKVLVQH